MACCCAIPSTFCRCLSKTGKNAQETSESIQNKDHKSPLILVLYTGGTIGMQPNEDNGIILLLFEFNLK